MRPVLVLLALLSWGCGGWNHADTAAQAAVTASLLVDYRQSRGALDAGGEEENPVAASIGPETYFPAAAVLAAGAAAVLPRPWRGALQGSILGFQVHTIAGNYVRVGRLW